MSGPQVDFLMELTGDKELDAKLRSMEHGASRIARRAVSKGIRVIGKAQKSAAPDADMRRTIGVTLKKSSAGEAQAKAGIGVGKKKSKTGKWYTFLRVTGTDLRSTGETRRRRKGGVSVKSTGKAKHNRGRIVPMADKFIRRATEGAKTEAAKVAGEAAWESIKQLAAK